MALGGGDVLALGLHLQQAEFLLILHLGKRRDGQVGGDVFRADELKMARAVAVEGHAAKRAEHRIELNVELVSRRGGLGVLDSLSASARAWLPPTVAPPSEALAAKFTDLIGGMSHGSGPSVEGMLAAQNLRDATMAWRIAEALAAEPGALVVHVNGSFHSEGGLGVPEHLARFAPDAETLVVTMRPAADALTPGDDVVIATAE